MVINYLVLPPTKQFFFKYMPVMIMIPKPTIQNPFIPVESFHRVFYFYESSGTIF